MKKVKNQNNDIFKLSKVDIERDYYGRTLLMDACLEGTLNDVKYWCEQGADVNLESEWGTPLECACYRGDLDIVKYLIEVRDADVNAYEHPLWGLSILHTACYECHLDVVKYLVDDVGMDVSQSEGRYSIISSAFQVATVSTLETEGKTTEENKKQIESRSKERMKKGKLILEYLVRSGADTVILNRESNLNKYLPGECIAFNITVALKKDNIVAFERYIEKYNEFYLEQDIASGKAKKFADALKKQMEYCEIDEPVVKAFIKNIEVKDREYKDSYSYDAQAKNNTDDAYLCTPATSDLSVSDSRTFYGGLYKKYTSSMYYQEILKKSKKPRHNRAINNEYNSKKIRGAVRSKMDSMW